MNKLTFEQLPEAITLLLEKVNKIEAMLSQGIQDGMIVKEILTAKEAAELMDISMSSLYKMTYNNEVPFYKPGGNKLYFKKEELLNWIFQYRIKPRVEIEKEAINYVIKNPRKY